MRPPDDLDLDLWLFDLKTNQFISVPTSKIHKRQKFGENLSMCTGDTPQITLYCNVISETYPENGILAYLFSLWPLTFWPQKQKKTDEQSINVWRQSGTLKTNEKNSWDLKEKNEKKTTYVKSDVADDTGGVVHWLQNVQYTGHCQRVAAQLNEF